jgi:hypothetical protein
MIRFLQRSLLIAAGGSLALVLPVASQVQPLGPEFQVNTYTTGGQSQPRISVAPDGGFTILWCCGQAKPPAGGAALVAQRFEADGTTVDGEFALSESEPSSVSEIAADPEGDFTVAWGAGSSGCPACWVDYVKARRFTVAGSPVGAQFAVSDPPGTGYTATRSVTVGADGGFVVAWDEYGAWAKRYDPDGTPLGAAFAIGGELGYASYPVLTSRPDGGFLVVWEEFDSTFAPELRGQRYSAEGLPTGPPIPVAPRDLWPHSPDLAATSTGDFVVTWTAWLNQVHFSVQARRFDAEGTPSGPPFAVHSFDATSEYGARVEWGADGDFVVAWTSYGSPGTDDSSVSVQGRRFVADGTPLGGQIQLNSFTTGYQSRPAVGVQPNGDLVVAWSSEFSPGNDSSSSSVLARHFRPAFFFDGFESGDASRWSAVEPITLRATR